MEKLIYLDTHVVVWLYAGQTELFSKIALNAIRQNDLLISPIVELEIEYLHETDRISVKAETVVAELSETIGLRKCEKDFSKIVNRSLRMSWTRDPFDRIITAQASINNSRLLTKDRTILKHYQQAFWD
jgi:PIN domain nuclease of toxin-antitoxin system